MSRAKKNNQVVISLILVIACLFTYCLQSFFTSKQTVTTQATIRTIEVKQNQMDFQSILKEYENASLETKDSITTFEGTKTFNILDFCELDLVSDFDADQDTEIKVKYRYDYDSEANIITLTATLLDEKGNPTVDTLVGVPFVDDNGNLDCVFDCDGEYILLSELQDAGMIENCGWFKNLFKKVATAVKKVTNTVIGKVGAALTVAVPLVIGVVAGALAAPVLPVIAAGALVGAGISAGTAIASTYQQDGKVDWETVGICAGVGCAVGAISSFLGYKAGQLIRKMFPKSNPSTNVKSFDTYSQFKKEYGKASNYIKDGEWHHIVEQQTVEKGINTGTSVYNSQNTVAISKNLHHKISGYYSQMNLEYGMTNRAYINTLSYEQQYTKGLEILKMFEKQLGETIIWL